MKTTLKTLLVATAVVGALGVAGAAVAGPGFGACGPGYGHGHGFTRAQGQGPGMMGGGMMQQRLMQFDTNQDGAITKDEMRAHHDQRFDAIDADKDGVISEAEFLAATPQAFGFGPMAGVDPSTLPADKQARMQEHRAFMFRGFDVDNSGTLTKDEFAAHLDARFEMMDANSDGRITADELGPRGKGFKRGPAPAPTPAPAQ